MGIRRAVAVLLLGGVAMVVTATPAFARTELDASLPREGILIAEPRQIVLSFTASA